MAEERRRLLERVAAARFSYAEMAKRSLGAHWRELTDAEREEFVALFQRLLVKTYARTIEGYAGQQVQYLGERRAEDFAEVRTKIVSDKVETPVDFRLLRMRGDWWVYDVVVDGVSVVSNYRGQFAEDPPRILVCRSRGAVAQEGRSRSPPRPLLLTSASLDLCIRPYASERSFSGKVPFGTRMCMVAPSSCGSLQPAAPNTISQHVMDWEPWHDRCFLLDVTGPDIARDEATR